jgi:protocatechuate 3,4-dioxygenase beta subunit
LAETIQGVNITVSPATSLVGKVVSRADGKPCPAGTVTLGPTGARSAYDPPSSVDPPGSSQVPGMVATIESDGHVRFPAVTRGVYHAVVQCLNSVLTEGPTTVRVDDVSVNDVVWKVDSGIALTVHVIDDSGQPLANAPFALSWPPDKNGAAGPEMSLTADATGSYQTPSVLYPGKYRLLSDSGGQAEPVEVDLHEGSGRNEATLRLAGRGYVLVNVRTASGEPIDAVRVSASLVNNAPSAKASQRAGGAAESLAAQTGSVQGVPLGNGRFRIGPCASGRYKVAADDFVNPPAAAADGLVELRERSVETTITLDRPGSIRGVVADAANQPLPDVWVSAACRSTDAESQPKTALLQESGPTGRRAATDSQGRFVLTGIDENARCTVRAERPHGAVGVQRDVRAGASVSVTLPELASLRGVAVTPDGKPVLRFLVSLRETQTGAFQTQELIAVDGHWSLAKVPPGQVLLFADDGHGSVARQQLALAPGQTIDSVSLQFLPRDQAQAAFSPADKATNP